MCILKNIPNFVIKKIQSLLLMSKLLLISFNAAFKYWSQEVKSP
jgi:hypothetical protein